MLEKKKSTGDIKALLLYDVKDLDPYLSVSGFFLRRAAANPNSVWGIAYGIRFGLTAFTTFLFCLYGFLLFQDNYRGLPYLFLHFFAFIMAVIYVIDLDKNLPKNFKSHNPKLPAITENTDLERISHFVENDFYQGAWQRGTFGKSTLTGMSPAGSGDTVSPGTSNSLLLVPPINRPNWEEEKSSREGTEEGCSQRTSGRTSGERTSGESISNVEKESITNTKGGDSPEKESKAGGNGTEISSTKLSSDSNNTSTGTNYSSKGGKDFIVPRTGSKEGTPVSEGLESGNLRDLGPGSFGSVNKDKDSLGNIARGNGSTSNSILTQNLTLQGGSNSSSPGTGTNVLRQRHRDSGPLGPGRGWKGSGKTLGGKDESTGGTKLKGGGSNKLREGQG